MTSLFNIPSLHAHFEDVLARAKSPLLLSIRLYWGLQFAQNGWGKLQHLPKIVEYFTSLGVPVPGLTTPAIATLEFVGGILLMLGLFSRLSAFLLVCDMAVAFIVADKEALGTALSSDPSKFLAADPFSFLFACLVIAVFGAGLFSVDHLLAHRRRVAVPVAA